MHNHTHRLHVRRVLAVRLRLPAPIQHAQQELNQRRVLRLGRGAIQLRNHAVQQMQQRRRRARSARRRARPRASHGLQQQPRGHRGGERVAQRCRRGVRGQRRVQQQLQQRSEVRREERAQMRHQRLCSESNGF